MNELNHIVSVFLGLTDPEFGALPRLEDDDVADADAAANLDDSEAHVEAAGHRGRGRDVPALRERRSHDPVPELAPSPRHGRDARLHRNH
jgi:hypothetical protein